MGLIKYNLTTDKKIFYRIRQDDPDMISTNVLYSIAIDEESNLWLGSLDGLTYFHVESEQFTYYRYKESDLGSINDHLIWKVFIDPQGLIWAGAHFNGVNIFNPHLIRFDHIFERENDSTGFQGKNVFSFDEDRKGNIWIGTIPGGTNRYNPITKSFLHYQSNDNDPGVWSRNYVASILVDRDDTIWIGTFSAGLFALNPNTNDMAHYRYYGNNIVTISHNDIYDLCETRDGSIWIGTNGGGLNRYDLESNKFTYYTHDPADSTSISSNLILTLLEDRSGMLWIGTSNQGLNRYNPTKDSFTIFTHSTTQNSISNNAIHSLYEDESENLWIGTGLGGLNKLNPERDSFSVLDIGYDGQSTQIASIQQDDSNYLWLGTNRGLLKVHPDSGLTNTYLVKDGVQSSEFLFDASLRDSKGYLYFGGVNGFNRFHPDSIKNNSHIPPVVITSFMINYEEVLIGKEYNGRVILTKSITETDAITLTYLDKTLSFTYAAMDYSDPERNRFKYYLENFDDGWINADTRRFVTYTSLNPGEYVFHVKASNNDGVWNEEGVSLSIIIKPPFWKTWWFILGGILILGIGIYSGFIIRLRIVQTQERQKAKEEKYQLKLDHQQRELVTKSMDLIEKQDFMEEVLYEIKMIKDAPSAEQARIMVKLIQRLSHLVSFNHVWEEFEKWFTEIHSGFIRNLKEDYPTLTTREIKVCALLRLNMLSKEIAGLMNVEPTTVEIYRYRIRKKLGLSKGKNLISFLCKY